MNILTQNIEDNSTSYKMAGELSEMYIKTVTESANQIRILADFNNDTEIKYLANMIIISITERSVFERFDYCD